MQLDPQSADGLSICVLLFPSWSSGGLVALAPSTSSSIPLGNPCDKEHLSEAQVAPKQYKGHQNMMHRMHPTNIENMRNCEECGIQLQKECAFLESKAVARLFICSIIINSPIFLYRRATSRVAKFWDFTQLFPYSAVNSLGKFPT